MVLVAFASTAEAHGRVSVSFGLFYSSLDPHGEWIPIDRGFYAWRPVHVMHGWRPYALGRWVWTDDGWYWVSDEPWGWATYHYGRWYYDDYYGWIWIPGYEWAPAWVEWRYGGDYIGWAPLGPYAVFSIGIGIHYPHDWVTPHFYWSFVGCRYIAAPSIHKHLYRPEENRRYIGRTRSIGTVRYDGGRIVTNGPDKNEVERRGNIRVRKAEIIDVSDRNAARVIRSKNNGERIEVYRPRIEAQGGNSEPERPSNLREAKRRILVDPKRSDLRIREQEQVHRKDQERETEGKRKDDRVPLPPVKREQGDDRTRHELKRPEVSRGADSDGGRSDIRKPTTQGRPTFVPNRSQEPQRKAVTSGPTEEELSTRSKRDERHKR